MHLDSQYHIGFRSQAATWPVHPLALIAQSLLSSLPANALIADFGCGDAALARTLVPTTAPAVATLPAMPSLKVPAKLVAQKQLKVASFDLLSQSSYVVEAECSSVPLPGGDAGGEIVDAVVCCLSLMGTDWIRMVREAKRVLKDGCVPSPSLPPSLGARHVHRTVTDSPFVPAAVCSKSPR